MPGHIFHPPANSIRERKRLKYEGSAYLQKNCQNYVKATTCTLVARLKSNWKVCEVLESRDGFRERRALGHLSFWAPRKCDLFGRLCEKCESMPLLCVVPPQTLSFVVPTLVPQLP